MQLLDAFFLLCRSLRKCGLTGQLPNTPPNLPKLKYLWVSKTSDWIEWVYFVMLNSISGVMVWALGLHSTAWPGISTGAACLLRTQATLPGSPCIPRHWILWAWGGDCCLGFLLPGRALKQTGTSCTCLCSRIELFSYLRVSRSFKLLVLLVCMQDWLAARYLVMAYRDKSLLVDSQGCSLFKWQPCITLGLS